MGNLLIDPNAFQSFSANSGHCGPFVLQKWQFSHFVLLLLYA